MDLFSSIDTAETRQTAAAELTNLRQAIAQHAHLYHAEDAPVISDADFDGLIRRHKELETLYPELADKIRQPIKSARRRQQASARSRIPGRC